ncbi:MAG: hypothetical protein ACJ79A_18815 [Gemmatimonadaceae bacterium]
MSDCTLADVRVRPARHDDQSRMLELWERSVRASHHFLEEGDVETIRPLVAAEDALKMDVNERNGAALPFYEALGFSVIGRSPTDAGSRPFPIVHMRRASAVQSPTQS